MDIRLHLAYADNTQALLRATLEAHPEALRHEFETLSHFNSIFKQVAHLIGAERRWTLLRLYDEAPPSRYEDAPADTLAGLFSDWDAIRARTRTFVETADDVALKRVIPILLPHLGYEDSLPAAEVLLHLFNHQTYHLGQISMFFQMQGIDPPNFDYILLHGKR